MVSGRFFACECFYRCSLKHTRVDEWSVSICRFETYRWSSSKALKFALHRKVFDSYVKVCVCFRVYGWVFCAIRIWTMCALPVYATCCLELDYHLKASLCRRPSFKAYTWIVFFATAGWDILWAYIDRTSERCPKQKQKKTMVPEGWASGKFLCGSLNEHLSLIAHNLQW